MVVTMIVDADKPQPSMIRRLFTRVVRWLYRVWP